MKPSLIIRKKAQAGFTLIELIVVIVILGILAATALPRLFDMSGKARLAKMQAAVGAVRAASATTHASWLMNGGQLGCPNCGVAGAAVIGTIVSAEGKEIKTFGGYPDVGGDANVNLAKAAATSGIVVAAGLEGYEITTETTPGATPLVESATVVTIYADKGHPNCKFTYTEATIDNTPGTNPPGGPATTGSVKVGVAPVIVVTADETNCA